MKQNKYDQIDFFNQYAKMSRSIKGLDAAGEWHQLKEMIPNLSGKRVLDLGCGYGWHCLYALEQNASQIVGIDISEKMIEKARSLTTDDSIKYHVAAMEDFQEEEGAFDVVISSLAIHYIKSFQMICEKVFHYLADGGTFVFSVEHPIFTARQEQDWIYDDKGRRLHWPVDHYHTEGLRETMFLNEKVTKYNRTVSTYLNELMQAGFIITNVAESIPSIEMQQASSEMKDEVRRPMFLLISAVKKAL